MSKKSISNESDCRTNGGTKYDPLMRIGSLRDKVRTVKAIDVVSQVVSSLDLDYEQFVEVVGALLHYYENVANVQGVKPEELCSLPPVLIDESIYDD